MPPRSLAFHRISDDFEVNDEPASTQSAAPRPVGGLSLVGTGSGRGREPHWPRVGSDHPVRPDGGGALADWHDTTHARTRSYRGGFLPPPRADRNGGAGRIRLSGGDWRIGREIAPP